MAHILLVALLIFLMFCLWVLYCDERTGQQRELMITHMYSKLGVKQDRAGFDDVSYEEHMWALVWFQDPRKLYNMHRVKAIIKGAREEEGKNEIPNSKG